MATLQAKFETREDGRSLAWGAQLRGPCNQKVTDPGALKASEEVIKALNAKLEARFEEKAAAQEGSLAESQIPEGAGVLGALALRRQALAANRPDAQAPRELGA